MMRGMMRWAGTMLAALVMMAGCSSNTQGAGPGGSEDFVRVVVQNDGTIPTQVRVHLVPLSGPEINLGSMSTLGAETLTARAPVIRGRYVLRAEGGTGYRLTSPAVDLRGSDTIVWDMRLNQVRLQR
ncbi:MAG TPA: hypothetical protein VLK84_31280 [Longimicrobium sp.]|nr:hypothetical protein [Longimicrobium sp.]